jgi:uncharacterized protein GlcG (DUF336 family)
MNFLKNLFDFPVMSSTIILSLGIGLNSVYAETSPVTTIKRLTLETANKIAMEAVKACRKKGVQITATVVDRNGIVQAVARDTLAPDVSLRISRMKAYTAANFSANTSSMAARAGSAIGNVEGLVMASGGNIINVGGFLYGAVGVSGAPSGKTDEQCALSGISKVIDDLEMLD